LSEVRNPYGEVIARTTEYSDIAVAQVNLDYELVHQDFNAEKLAALQLKYREGVRIYNPGGFGSVMVSSESDSISVDEMLDEFGMERLDQYLARSLAHNRAAAAG
jgi:hypothetical protein